VVFSYVVDAGPRERPADGEDDLGVPSDRRSGIHYDFTFDDLGPDLVGQHLDDVVRRLHAGPSGLLTEASSLSAILGGPARVSGSPG